MRRLTGKVGCLHRNRIILCHAVKNFGKEDFSLTDLKDFAPVQINSLYGFENVKDFYWLIGYDVVNVSTGRKLKYSLHKGKTPFFAFATKDKTRDKKALLHHLLALAYMRNAPFEAVEHIDANPLNYDISNLRFVPYSVLMSHANKRKAYKKRSCRIFEVTLKNGEIHTGSIPELSARLGIDKQTFYKRYRKQTSGRKIQSQTHR